MLRHTVVFYTQFFLVFVLFFFSLAYAVSHQETIDQEIRAITEGTLFFASSTAKEILPRDGARVVESNTETYEIERLLHEQINLVREDRGLQPLIWDPVIADIARGHSLGMATYQYFNHTNLDGQDPTDRAREAGMRTIRWDDKKVYRGIGENLGFMPKGVVKDVGILVLEEDVASAMVLEWMLSEPHRKNILQEDYKYTGIGVIFDGDRSYYITQNFQ